MKQYSASTAMAFALVASGLAACSGGGGSSASPAAAPASSPPPAVTTGNVSISGKITFDHVPHNASAVGLDYNNITSEPARGVIVEAAGSTGTVLASTTTDSSGDYSLSVPVNTEVRIRARARMQQTSGAQWDVRVVDNTSNDALYILSGDLSSSGAANSVRNLNAPSGWGGSSYTGARAAAPFAILDSIYIAMTGVATVDPDVVFPELQVYWSTQNNSADGNVDDGDLGSSFYTRFDGISTIALLGSENNDTEEYDEHVIVHEFGHFLEDRLSRSDSIGGPHSITDRLDPRVAFGEGFGSAVAGILLQNPIYRDTLGTSQSSGFAFSTERNNVTPAGWFNERSIISILYDIADPIDDGVDVISAGFGPMYNVLISSDYRNSPEPTTIFLFIDELRRQTTLPDADITALVAAQSISGTGPQGVGETNDGGIPTTLPVVKTVAVGGTPVEICSLDNEGDTNKHGNRNLVRFSLPTPATVTMSMTKTSGPVSTDPDFLVFRNGGFVATAGSGNDNSETLTRTLNAGEYLVDAYEFNVVEGTGTDACFNFAVN